MAKHALGRAVHQRCGVAGPEMFAKRPIQFRPVRLTQVQSMGGHCARRGHAYFLMGDPTSLVVGIHH